MKVKPQMEFITRDYARYEFIHFDTIHERDLYLLNNSHLIVSHLCCGDKGVAIEKRGGIDKIYTKPETISPKLQIKSTLIGTCDICFLDGVELHRTCQRCVQPFCADCLAKIVSKVCPYCRGKLTNNHLV